MEYIRVKVNSPLGSIKTAILINGQKNGITGKTLEVEAGILEVSAVSIAGLNFEIQSISIKPSETSIQKPKEVTINVKS
jgi:hypothetical protein